MKVGFIGLGSIGSVLAGHLLAAGYSLVVHDLRQEAGTKLVAGGAEWAETPAAAAAAAEVLITSLPGPPQVRAVMEGAGNVLVNLRPGTTWIEMSTTDAAEVRRLGVRAAARGCDVLEAPVTGGLALAKAGGITILVGGEPRVFQRHLNLLQTMGGQVLHMGPLGAASIVKVLTNLLALGHLLLAGEAFMLGKMAGIDLNALFAGIKASSGNSYTIETEIPLVYDGTYDVGFSMALACKDLGLASQLGRHHGVPLEFGALVEQVFLRAKAAYGSDANSTQAVKLLEDTMKVYLRAPSPLAGGDEPALT